MLYAIILAFFAGLGFFMYEFVTESQKWAFSAVNRHLSENSIAGGKITDINGLVLVQNVNGKRIYNEDENIRKAVLHTVGDGCVLIPTSIQSRYSKELFGYNPVTGFGAPRILNMNKNIKLTIDAHVCSDVSKSFKDYKGAAVAYNYLTGDVLCMVSLPTYDVYNRPSAQDLRDERYEGVYINRVVSSSFTPGSIFKIFTTAAALDFIPDVESRIFNCDKIKIVDGEKVTCMNKHGNISLQNAFSKSCDIVFGDIGIEIGGNKMKLKMEEFGFNKTHYFDGMAVAQSDYEVKDASLADLAWSAIGQYKDKVNPMHMLKLMGAIANHGECIEPKIVKECGYGSGSFSSGKLQKSHSDRLMRRDTADKIKEMMRYAVKNQYKDSLFGGIPMCAKTGTAEVGEGKLPHGWMVGFSYDKTFPIAFSVVVEHGDFGIKSAGPITSILVKGLYREFKNNKYS